MNPHCSVARRRKNRNRQTIIVDMQGDDRPAVIERLVQWLTATGNLGIDVDLLRPNLLRQAEKVSSFVAPELVIAHAVTDGDGPILGVLGFPPKAGR